jgi:hypothetical protein
MTPPAVRPIAPVQVVAAPARATTFRSAVPAVPARCAFGPIELMGSQMRFGGNEEIFGEDEPADYVYKVVSGAVRSYRIMSDGRPPFSFSENSRNPLEQRARPP